MRSEQVAGPGGNFPDARRARGKGDVLKAQGHLEEAWMCYTAALKLLRPTPFKGAGRRVLTSMAEVRDAQGRRAEAARLHDRAAATYRRARDARYAVW